jgi:hypothetical protein
MTKEAPMPNVETVLRARGLRLLCLWFGIVSVLIFLMTGSIRAEIRQTVLDWEPACEGSSITVTSQKGQLVLVEASAWHFAEAREWFCVYKDGSLLAVTFRHYTLSRKAKGDSGEFEVQSTLDQIETFQAEHGVVQKVPEALKADLETVLSKARKSLSEPAKLK